ncbi:ABC transporter substrate-binding protein [Rhizohabitans arisaemae]|uniref:ABC transporter substrate-binding protein n=1 Tax=Rhizohabitans arisaemae TaxID=2720610 RepID=UPI0024B137CA|nr:ABC transporter substrate-binding protein [Rhizohabitans arisaemae]
MRRLFRALIAITATTGLVTACGGGGEANDNATTTGGTFTMAQPGDPGVVDPYRNVISLEVSALAYDGLVNVTPDRKVVSGLAETWQTEADSTTFTLKAGITCSDGTSLTASQVAAALEFVKDPKNGSTLYGLLVPTIPFTVKADDSARTVTVTMEKPFGFVLETIGRVPIVCAKGMADPAMLKNASSGTGPFTLSEVVPGDHYTFTVRKGYTWGPNGASTDAPGTPSKVVIQVVANETTAANLLLSGDVNLARISGADQDRMTAQNLKYMAITSRSGELWFNQRDKRPGSEAPVRKALTAALNLDELARVSTSGKGKRPTAIVGSDPKPCGADTLTGRLPAHDPAKAASLLDEAGWTVGADGVRGKNGKPLRMDLHYSAGGEGGPATAELVAKQWKAVGVEVKLTADDSKALSRAMFETGDFDAFLVGLRFTMPYQVVPFVSGQVPPKGQNFTGVDNADYQRLSTEAVRTSGDAGCALWNEAEQALFGNVDLVPFADLEVPFFLSGAEAQTDGWLQMPIPTSIRLRSS